MPNKDPIIAAIINDLQTERGCHTIILYGSRARGDATASSDYDVCGIRATGEAERDARLWQGAYLDLFIFPEAKCLQPDESLIYMREGVVLVEKDGFGTKFLAGLAAVHAAGPKKLTLDESNARKVWAWKMLERSRTPDCEGHYRRHWLLYSLLEDFFALRNEWYPGSKAGLAWLNNHRPDAYAAFARALEPTADIAALESLVAVVTEATHRR